MVLEELMKSHGQTFAFPMAKSPTKMDRLALHPHHGGHHATAGAGSRAATAAGDDAATVDNDSPRNADNSIGA